MRRKHTLRSAGPYKSNPLPDLRWRRSQTIRKQELIRQCRITAREVVGSAVPFGLPDYRDDFGGIDLSGIDESLQLRDIIWGGHRQLADTNFHVHPFVL